MSKKKSKTFNIEPIRDWWNYPTLVDLEFEEFANIFKDYGVKNINLTNFLLFEIIKRVQQK